MGAVAALTLLLTACTGSKGVEVQANYSTVSGATAETLESAVTQAMQWSRSTEAVVGVWSPDGDYVQAFTAEGGEVTDSNAQFRAAQTGQPFICALLLDVVAEGLVTLDREVAEDLPRQTGIGDVTYGQLCDGTSGLADFKSLNANLSVTNPTRSWPTGELIAQSLIAGPLSWPGLNVHRSDTNSVLLGRALGVVTGQTLQEMYEERIFTPAGMQATYIPRPSDLTITGENALDGIAFPPGPVCDAGTLELSQVSPTVLGEPGSAVSTVTDLKTFYEHYLSGTFGGTEAVAVLSDTRPAKNPERDEEGNPTEEIAEGGTERSFGMLKHGPLFGFNGAYPGSLTATYHDPGSGLTVAVALNNSTAGAGFAEKFALQLAAIMAEQEGTLEVPWTAEERAASLADGAICQDVAEEAAE